MREVNIDDILNIVNCNLDKVNITMDEADADLSQFGLESISFINLIVGLEERFDCEIPDSLIVFSELNTINKIIDQLRRIYVSVNTNK